MDSTAQWTQEFGMTRSMEEIASSPIVSPPCSTRPAEASLMEKKIMMRPPKDKTLNCPRCHSTNTKFCYYNNYSLTQPRYFCKTCRRYWTEGGTLRNVPVGGGSRKHHKKSSIPTTTNTPNYNLSPPLIISMAATLTDDHDHQLPIIPSQKLLLPDLNPPSTNNIISHFSSYHHQNPKIHDDHHQGQDLNLGFHQTTTPVHDHYHHHHGGVSQFLDQFPNVEGRNVISSSTTSSSSTPLSALDFLRNGNYIAASRGLNNSFIPNMSLSSSSSSSSTNFASGFPFQECMHKPSLAFSIDGDNIINGSTGYVNSNVPSEENMNGTLMFTLGATKRHSSTSDQGDGDHDQQDKGSHENNFNGFWNGMFGGGGSW